MKILNIEIPTYNEEDNFIKLAEHSIIDWTINRKDIIALEKIYKAKCKGVKKKRVLIKNKNDGSSTTKIVKLEIKDEIKSEY